MSGRGIGTVIGALTVASPNGIRSGYLGFGILAAFTSITYSIAYHFYLKGLEKIRLSKTPGDQGLNRFKIGIFITSLYNTLNNFNYFFKDHVLLKD